MTTFGARWFNEAVDLVYELERLQQENIALRALAWRFFVAAAETRDLASYAHEELDARFGERAEAKAA